MARKGGCQRSRDGWRFLAISELERIAVRSVLDPSCRKDQGIICPSGELCTPDTLSNGSLRRGFSRSQSRTEGRRRRWSSRSYSAYFPCLSLIPESICRAYRLSSCNWQAHGANGYKILFSSGSHHLQAPFPPQFDLGVVPAITAPLNEPSSGHISSATESSALQIRMEKFIRKL